MTTFNGAKVTLAADQVIAAGGAPISWETELFDTNNFWDAGAPTIFTIPTTAKYVIGCTLLASGLSITLPGDINDILITNLTAGNVEVMSGDDAVITVREFSVAALVDATVGDTFNVGAGFVNGGTINSDPTSAQASFWIFRYS